MNEIEKATLKLECIKVAMQLNQNMPLVESSKLANEIYDYITKKD